MVLGKAGKFSPMMGNHRLVRGDNMFAIFQRGPRQFNRNTFAATNHFNNNIDIIAACQINGIVMPVNLIHRKSAIGSSRTRAYRHQLQSPPTCQRQPLLFMHELTRDFAANNTKAGNRNFQRRHILGHGVIT